MLQTEAREVSKEESDLILRAANAVLAEIRKEIMDPELQMQVLAQVVAASAIAGQALFGQSADKTVEMFAATANSYIKDIGVIIDDEVAAAIKDEDAPGFVEDEELRKQVHPLKVKIGEAIVAHEPKPDGNVVMSALVGAVLDAAESAEECYGQALETTVDRISAAMQMLVKRSRDREKEKGVH